VATRALTAEFSFSAVRLLWPGHFVFFLRATLVVAGWALPPGGKRGLAVFGAGALLLLVGTFSSDYIMGTDMAENGSEGGRFSALLPSKSLIAFKRAVRSPARIFEPVEAFERFGRAASLGGVGLFCRCHLDLRCWLREQLGG
jgi:hypothetical protein